MAPFWYAMCLINGKQTNTHLQQFWPEATEINENENSISSQDDG